MTLEDQIRAIVKDEMAKAKPVEDGETRASSRMDRAARALVTMLHLYNGHKTDSRGPSGCIIDALQAVAPDIVDELRDEVTPADIYTARWGEE